MINMSRFRHRGNKRESLKQRLLSEFHEERISKRLAYVLRYGAEKENLTVYENGFVRLDEVLELPLMHKPSPDEILNVVDKSTSARGCKRFEKKMQNGVCYIRATYGVRMQRNPHHTGSRVIRLLDQCMNYVCKDVKQFDLEDFPDEYLINSMIHKLKLEKRLNNSSLRCLLGSTVEHLDLDGVYVTEATLKLIGQRCPNLRHISLRGCGYLMTDHMLAILLKKLPMLESVNLAGCTHLTNHSLEVIHKHTPNIRTVNLADARNISAEAILKFLQKSSHLHHLDIYGNRTFSDALWDELCETAVLHGITISHHYIKD